MLLHFFVTTRISQTCLIFALLIVVHAQDSTQPLIRSTTAPTSWMIPHHEHEALVELYESCSGASWGPLYTSTWLRSGSICGVWAGVECSFYEEPSPSLTTETNKGLAHVTGLTIANIPLRCELPTSLAALVHIRSIDFTNSPLYGQRFPEVIRAWFYIETIRLRGTHIVGALPNWLSRRSRLRFLDVSENSELFGAIPASYAALVHLSVFLAHNTMLQGRIPPFLEHVTEWNLRSENASEFDAPCPPPAWVWKGINENQLACSRTPGIMPVLGPVQHPPQMIINTTVPEELTYPPAVAPDTTPSSQQNKEEREVEKILDSINGEEVWMWEDPSGANGSASSNTTRALNATYPSTDTWGSSTTLGTPSEDVISGTGLILLIISVIGTLIGMSYLMRRVASRAGYLDLNDTDAITQMSHSV